MAFQFDWKNWIEIAHMRDEAAIAEGNTGVFWIPALFLQVSACFASNGHPDTYPLMPLISISIVVITVINFTVSSNVSLSSVDQWLLPSLILDQKHEEKRINALAGGAQLRLSPADSRGPSR